MLREKSFRIFDAVARSLFGRAVLISVGGIDSGAEAYRRDLPNAEVHLLDTGHFALETHAAEIGALMREFLERNGIV